MGGLADAWDSSRAGIFPLARVVAVGGNSAGAAFSPHPANLRSAAARRPADRASDRYVAGNDSVLYAGAAVAVGNFSLTCFPPRIMMLVREMLTPRILRSPSCLHSSAHCVREGWHYPLSRSCLLSGMARVWKNVLARAERRRSRASIARRWLEFSQRDNSRYSADHLRPPESSERASGAALFLSDEAFHTRDNMDLRRDRLVPSRFRLGK